MILARLREQTREAHELLEARIDILERASSSAAYRELLEKFYGFYLPFERRLAAVAAQDLPDFDFAARRKVPLLEQDFHALGVSSDQFSAFPFCQKLPALEPVSRMLGCLYVMEGATLGGRIISRHLQTTLGLDATNGAAFFNGYGSETGAMWRAFGETLRHYAQTHTEDTLILQGAVETFAAFEAWFTQGENAHE